jgi:hypothetical protein
MKARVATGVWLVLALAACARGASGRDVDPAKAAAGNFRSGAGFSFRVAFDKGWPVLSHNTNQLPLPTYRRETQPVLTVVLGDGRAPKPRLTGGWEHLRAEYDLPSAAGAKAALTVSRLSPAVLIESAARGVTLGWAGKPKYVACVRGGEVAAVSAGNLDGAKLSEPWLLVWFGDATPLRGWSVPFDVEDEHGVSKPRLQQEPPPVDLPVLVRLERSPSSIAAVGTNLALSFARPAGKIAVMPLFGGRVFLPQETEAWRSGLPGDVLAQCRLWSAKLRDYPLRVEEAFAANAGEGVLEVRQRFWWASFDDDWKTPRANAMPVPPMLAAALGGGAPVEFFCEGQMVRPVDYHLMDTPGKAMGVERSDGYVYLIRGLRELVRPERHPVPAAPAARPCQQKLERHVAEMVEAGPLRPLLYIYGGIGGTWFSHFHWGRSAELAAAIAEAHPYLSKQLQPRAVAYLQGEWRRYPPLRFDRGRYGFGRLRTPYEFPWAEMRQLAYALQREEAYRRNDFFHELYGLEAYLALTGEKPPPGLKDEATKLAGQFLARQDWAILGPSRLMDARDRHAVFYYNLQGAATYNRWLAGAIGFTRLARRFGWKDAEPLGWYLVGKFAMARVAHARYVAAVYEGGCVRGRAEDDNRALLHVDPTCAVVGRGPLEMGVHQNQELPPFYDLTEEVGRLLGRCARRECEVYLDHLDRSVPLWYVSEAPKQGATEQRTCPLQHHSGNVLAQYWVLGKRGEAFTRYLDTTRFLGDLYYIRNLAAAIESFYGAELK